MAETTAGEREVCPAKWCAYPMPHDHTSGSGPTFDALLSDPTQQLDTEGVVLASVLAHQSETRRLTTAEHEWLDDSMMHGFDALVDTVERLMERAADEVRPRLVAETTAGERDRTFLLPDDCDCLPPYADCTHGPADPDAGEVEALVKVIVGHQRIPTYADSWGNRCSGCDSLHGATDGPNSPRHAQHVAEQILASDWLAALLDRVRREEGAKVLREAADALNREGLSFKEGGWGSNPADQQTSAVMVKTLTWLRDRAASVGRGEGL